MHENTRITYSITIEIQLMLPDAHAPSLSLLYLFIRPIEIIKLNRFSLNEFRNGKFSKKNIWILFRKYIYYICLHLNQNIIIKILNSKT